MTPRPTWTASFPVVYERRGYGARMKLSRRYFLGAAAGSAATLWSFRSIGLEAPGSSPERVHDCALFDLNAHCILRESLQGYQAALGDKYNHFPEVGLNSRRHCRIAIVPGLGPIDPAMAKTLSSLLDAGTHVLLESGAGFLSPSEFTAHQEALFHYFDIEVGAPVDLWSKKSADDALLRHRTQRQPSRKLNRPESIPSIPYVNYSWPRQTSVRDFSRVIPVSARAGDVIGRVGVLPIALKKRTSGGMLIFLGSPLGPALRAGDPQARCWLRSVTAF
jgi:hypothetical protein